MLLAHHYKPRIGDLEWVEELVGIRPGQHVVDIGAGTGSYTFPLAERVGHSGKVLALEIDPSLIEYLEFMTLALQTPNVESVENLEEDLLLPDSVADLVLIVDLDRCSRLPSEFFSGTLGEQIRDSLKPDGHLVILRSYSTPSYEVYEEILAPKGLVLKAREQRLTRELLVFQQP